MKRIKFKHWKTGEELIEIGNLPQALNKNPNSDRFVLQTTRGEYVDIIKDTIIVMEDVNDQLQI